MTIDASAHAEITDLIGPLNRYVHAHVRPGQDADDVVQETLTRVIGAQNRLAPGVALAYAVVVARHVLADQATAADRARRNRHRLIDPAQPPRPDDVVLQGEERAALRNALAEVPPAQREALLAHVLQDEPVTVLAASIGTSSESLAAQLARTRAKLRVDYVLALRGIDLPTARCRPVLLAISAADTRRQNALRAGHHLLTCATCSSISEPLLRRRSALAALLPWLLLGPALGWLRRLIQTRPGPVAAVTGTATVAAGVAVIVAVHGTSTSPNQPIVRPPAAAPIGSTLPSPTPAPTPAPTPSGSSPATGSGPGELVRISDDAPLLPAPAELSTMTGDRVRARAIPVWTVNADEGFWIGDPRRGRIWVRLTHTGRESKPTIRPEDVVSFVGRVTANGPGFARRVGVTAAEGADQLTRQGVHLSVNVHDLRLSHR
jgi:RNA polymerase sigma factor (sigma-70 family)